MEKQVRVRVSVQRLEPQGNGRFKVKIAETGMNITNIVHGGVPYITVKKYGRGRYMMKQDPRYVKPVEKIDISNKKLDISNDREPMEYQEVQP